jgi:hypothetical protein
LYDCPLEFAEKCYLKLALAVIVDIVELEDLVKTFI